MMRFAGWTFLLIATWSLALTNLPPSAWAQSTEPATSPVAVRCLEFSPDGQSLAAAASDEFKQGVLIVWNLANFTPRYTLREEAGFPRLAYSPDGRILALARFAHEAKLLNAFTGELIRELAGHEDHARCVTFTPDGRKVVTGSYDRKLRIFDAETGRLEATLEGHTGPIYHVAVAPEGRLLATADARSYVARLWDLEQRKELHAWEKRGAFIPHVEFSPDGKQLAISGWNGACSLNNTSTYEPGLQFQRTAGVDWSAFSPDGKLLAVATQSPTLCLFDINQNIPIETQNRVSQLLKEFSDDSYAVREAAHQELARMGMAADRQLREAVNSGDPEVRWRARVLQRRLSRTDSALKLEGHSADLSCVCFSRDGQLLASGDQHGAVIVWSVGDWKPVAKLNIASH